MGTETKNSIKVGTEIDYYRGDGAKYMGKVIKMTPKGYIVKDDKNGKNYQFTYHDRMKAKKYLKQGDEAVSPDQQAAIAIAKKKKNESVMDTYKTMWAEGEKYAPQAPIEENMERKIMSKMRKSKAPKGLPR
jgi:hypothetical protein